MTVGLGFELFASNIARLLGPFSGWVRPVFFVAFFLLTAVAFHYQSRVRVRRAYLGFVLVCLIVVNVAGVQVLPMVTLHKFSSEGPEETTVYEVRMVDANGDELVYDARAVPPLPGSRLGPLAHRMVNRFDDDERVETAEFLFRRAQTYRAYVETEPLVGADRVEFPRHGLDFRWSMETLSEYGEFVGLRIYEVEVRYSEYGADVSQSEKVAFEWFAGNETATPTDVERTRTGDKRTGADVEQRCAACS